MFNIGPTSHLYPHVQRVSYITLGSPALLDVTLFETYCLLDSVCFGIRPVFERTFSTSYVDSALLCPILTLGSTELTLALFLPYAFFLFITFGDSLLCTVFGLLLSFSVVLLGLLL